MKRSGLLFLLLLMMGSSALFQPAFGQCTPSTTTTVAGVYPDPLPPGCVGQPYSEIADFVFPADTTVSGFTIPFDSFEVTTIANVPTGLSFVLNSSNNKYYPPSPGANARGCGDITGTPTMANTVADSVDISFRAWLTVPFIGSTSAVSMIRHRLAVFATPSAGFSAGAPSGNTVAFTDGSAGANDFFWDFGDGNTSTMQSPSHTYSGPGNYLVCQIVGNGNCSDTTCSTVTIGCPAPSVVWTSSQTGLVVSFTDQTLGNPQFWLWDFGDGNTSTTQNPTHTYAAAGNYTVCLTLTDSCGTDSTCGTVNACDLPVSGFTSAATSGTVDFTNASTNATTYLWDFGDGATSTMQDPSHTYAATGDYTVCLIATSTCGIDTTCSTVSVCIDPTAAFSFSDVNGTVTFNDLSTLNGSTTYAWDFGDGGSSTMQNPTYTYTASGMYTVCLTVTDSCGTDSSCQTVDVTISGLEQGLIKNLQLFPNPSQGNFTLQGSLTQNSDLDIQVTDILGRNVHSLHLGRISGAFKQKIELNGVQPGIYFVRAIADREVSVMKVIIERK